MLHFVYMSIACDYSALLTEANLDGFSGAWMCASLAMCHIYAVKQHFQRHLQNCIQKRHQKFTYNSDVAGYSTKILRTCQTEWSNRIAAVAATVFYISSMCIVS